MWKKLILAKIRIALLADEVNLMQLQRHSITKEDYDESFKLISEDLYQTIAAMEPSRESEVL